MQHHPDFRRVSFSALAALTVVLAASCSSAEEPRAASADPQVAQAADSGPYAVENAVLDRAVDRTGLPRDASLWIQRTADSRVVCGALGRPAGKPVLYMGGREGGYLGAPLANLEPAAAERLLDQWNTAVMTNCADNGLIPPERVRNLLGVASPRSPR
jgi:hypothetical protein